LALGPVNQTNLAAGAINNATLLIGCRFDNTTGALRATQRGNFLFGGVILTKTISAYKRYVMRSRFNEVTHRHLKKTSAEILALLDEVIVTKDINTSTGVVAGRKGQTSLTFNTGVGVAYNKNQNTGIVEATNHTSNLILSNQDAFTGIPSVYNPDGRNPGNGFLATNNFFANRESGTILSFHCQHSTPIVVNGQNTTTMANFLTSTIAIKDYNTTYITTIGGGGPYAQRNNGGDRALALGFNHTRPNAWGKSVDAIDTDGLTGARRWGPGVGAGTPVGDVLGTQQQIKYNRDTFHGGVPYNIAYEGYTYTESTYRNTDPSAPRSFDAPTGHHTEDNLVTPGGTNIFGFEFRDFAPVMQVMTFDKHPSFNRNNSYEANKPYLLSMKVRSYCSLPGVHIGHTTGSVAKNDNNAQFWAADDARIMSDFLQRTFEGSVYAFAFANQVLTEEQINQIAVNFYKIIMS
jgi:hypothetical protein